MKCKCGNQRLKYLQKKEKKKNRTDFRVECSKCGFRGEIRPEEPQNEELSREATQNVE